MTKDIISIKRFGRYFASDFRSGISQYWISGLIVAGMPILMELLVGIFSLIFTGQWASSPVTTRLTLGGIMMAVAMLTIPAKLYGHITDKKNGTSFIQLPVSTLEKSSSMILNAAVLFPAIVAILYCAVDALICLVDPGCGKALIACASEGLNLFRDRIMSNIPVELEGVMNVMNPALYIDDAIQISLVFLLGAVCFKKNKIAKTIAILIGLSIASSAITSPIMVHVMANLSESDAITFIMNRFGWIINHMALIDTVSDTIINLALAAGIYYRVKTIKF